MEQVDQIIIVTLRDIGLEVDTEITSLKKFTTQLIIKSVARCLNIIGCENKISEKLPDGMAGRYRLGIELADACKKLGYKADLGYETFLYSSDVEIRRLLMFLVEKLPRTRQDTDELDQSRTSSLQSSIASEIRRQLQLPWLPPSCHKNYLVWDGNKKNGCYHYVGGFRQFSSRNLKMSTTSQCLGLQCNSRELLPSLLHLSSKLNLDQEISTLNLSSSSPSNKVNIKEIVKKASDEITKSHDPSQNLISKLESSGMKPVLVEKEHNIFKVTESILYTSAKATKSEETPVDKGEDEEVLLLQHDAEKQELQYTLDGLNEKLESAQGKIDNATRRLEDLERSKKSKEEQIDKLKDEYLLKKKTLQLVPDEKDAITTMKGTLIQAHTVHQTMKDQWVTKESDLQLELDTLETSFQTKELQTSEHIEDVKLMREEISGLVASIESKEDLHKQLQEDVKNLPNSVNRNTHTKKILEIVARIKKQKAHINEILKETKTVQKEINSLNGKIERSFIETDEMIFRDAKNNDQCKKAYKLLANLQSEFNALVKGLDDIGVINRELRDIEDLLQREKEKNISDQIKKVSKDLKAVVDDNDGMIVSIKKVKSQK